MSMSMPQTMMQMPMEPVATAGMMSPSGDSSPYSTLSPGTFYGLAHGDGWMQTPVSGNPANTFNISPEQFSTLMNGQCLTDNEYHEIFSGGSSLSPATVDGAQTGFGNVPGAKKKTKVSKAKSGKSKGCC